MTIQKKVPWFDSENPMEVIITFIRLLGGVLGKNIYKKQQKKEFGSSQSVSQSVIQSVSGNTESRSRQHALTA